MHTRAQLATLSQESASSDQENSCFNIMNTPTRAITKRKFNADDENEVTPVKDKSKAIPFELEIEHTDHDYEQERLKRMRENMAVLKELDFSVIKAAVKNTIKKVNKLPKSTSSLRKVKAKQRPVPTRRSTRSNRATEKEGFSYAEADKLITSLEVKMSHRTAGKSKKRKVEDDLDTAEYEFAMSLEDRMHTCEEYWKLKDPNHKPRLIQDCGHFSGWVEESVRKRLGIAADKDAAWDSNPMPSTNSIGHTRDRAKEMARQMLHKNPNSYFYRHTAPDRDHWQGDWTEEEEERFIEVAKKYGVGDKWGLFATYIEHRVGYQCSNYYRAHFVGDGVIYDGSFMFTRFGETVFVGKKKSFY